MNQSVFGLEAAHTEYNERPSCARRVAQPFLL